MRYLRRSLVLVLETAALSLLTACLGVDVNTRFNEDGSGTMRTKLRISQLFLQIGRDAGVPLTKEELESAYRGLDGVSLRSVDQEDTEQDRIITSLVTFKSYAVFNNRKDFAGAGATLSTEEGRTVYRVMIGGTGKASAPGAGGENAGPASSTGSGKGEWPSPPSPPTGFGEGAEPPTASGPDETEQAMQAIMKSLVAGYSLSYTVTTPTRILSHSTGELATDGTSVHYSITMADYMGLERPVMLEVKW